MISIILPCYNEAEHLASSLQKIHALMSYCYEDTDFEILLLDDASTDATKTILENHTQPPFRVYYNDVNMGRGATVKKGIELSRGNIVGFMDVDCEVAEYYLPKFILSIQQGADFAIGQRIYRVAANPYILFRHVLSAIYKFILRKLNDCPIIDTEVGFKFFSRKFAQAVQQRSQFDGWFWDTECSLLAHYWGFKICEIPVAFLRNPHKTSSVHVVRDSWRYLKDFIRFLQLRRAGVYLQHK